MTKNQKPKSFSPILFIIWYRVLSALFLVPLSVLLFRLMLVISGIDYLSNETIGTFFKNPGVWFLIVVVLLLFALSYVVECCGLITVINESRRGRYLSISQIIKTGLIRMSRMIYPFNLPVFLYMIFAVPFIQIIPVLAVFSFLRLPEYIREFCGTGGAVAAFVIYIIANIFLVRYSFLPHAFILYEPSFKNALALNNRLMSTNYLRTLLSLVVRSLVFMLLAFVVFIVFSAIALVVIKFGSDREAWFDTALVVLSRIWILLSFVLVGIFPGVYCWLVGESYYAYCSEKEIASAKKRIHFKWLGSGMSIICSAMTFVMLIGTCLMCLNDSFLTKSLDINRIQVIAHRGVSSMFPENTIPAIEAAVVMGCKWAEIDVHQTKDKRLVLIHDPHLIRVAGIGRFVSDMDIQELAEVDVGSWFSPGYSYLRVPLLEDVLSLCKDRINLQIELKPTENDVDLEKNVIRMIRGYGMEKQCVLASQDIQCVKNCDRIAREDIKTLYITEEAPEDPKTLDFAEGISLERAGVDASVVNQYHKEGKECFVWTVNNPDQAAYLADTRVDGIITDDPAAIEHALFLERQNGVLKRVLERIYK